MAAAKALPPTKHKAFAKDAQRLSDTDLARKYGLSERTATNWRVKLVGARKTA